MKNLILFIAILLSLISCNQKSGKKLLPGSVGRYNELMVIANHKVWEGKIGKELKKVIASDVIGLPQPEPQFSITQIPHRGFDGFLKHNRNILSVEKSDVASFDIDYNVFSKPQIYAHLKGPDQQSIIKLIQENSDKLITVFKEHDLDMVQKRLGKKSYKKTSIEFFNKQRISLKVPTDYNKISDTFDFVWFRKRFEHYGMNVNGSLNIIAYTIPLEVPFSQVKDSIISIRNTIGKKHLPGGKEGTYLITEAAYTPHFFDAVLAKRNAYKVNGKWEVYKDFEAGPFVAYFVNDSTNKRIVVVEALVYAPAIKKRDFMFEAEAIIRSLQIE